MLDPKLLRSNPEEVAANLKKRGFKLDLELVKNLEEQRKELQTKHENIQHFRKLKSKEFGKLKASKQPTDELATELASLANELEDISSKLNAVQKQTNDYLSILPNIVDDHVPVGADETNNIVQEQVGKLPKLSFTPLDHSSIIEKYWPGLMEQATSISRSRFMLLSGGLARLHRILIDYMLGYHIKNGYQEYYVPYMVNSNSLYGTGQLPKFNEDLFKIDNSDLWLIPTAEVPLTNLVANKILSEKELPLKLVAHSPCFRSEAGSYGKDTKGLIRQHQFEKVEMVQIVAPKHSDEALEEMTKQAGNILESLELPYQKVLLCTGDLGFGSSKTYDLEVWLPSQNCYREIASISNFRDFQARRMLARHKTEQGNNELVHTLNGTGLAIGRTLVAILENYQTETGNVKVPASLKEYFGSELLI